jgi:hypothetical protein
MLSVLTLFELCDFLASSVFAFGRAELVLELLLQKTYLDLTLLQV